MTVRAMLVHRDLAFHGGVPRSFLNLAKHVDRNRVEFVVTSLQPVSTQMRDLFLECDVAVQEIPDSYVTGSQSLRSLIRNYGSDVIVCGSFRSYVVAKIAAAGLSTRVVFWVPGINLMESTLKRVVFRALARRDPLIFISQAVAEKHLFPGHQGSSYVVYHGIEDPFDSPDHSPYPKTMRQEFGIPADAVVLGYIAEFIPLKDHRVLINAFDSACRLTPTLRLLLVGTGSDYQQVIEFARSFSAFDRIHFLGARLDARRLLGLLDVYVHPAVGEGFGLAVAEAMFAGLPVVAANAGALPELVIDSETGLLFQPHDASDLQSKLEQLIKDPTLRERLGKKARSLSAQRFDIIRFANEMTNILETEATLTKRRRPRA